MGQKLYGLSDFAAALGWDRRKFSVYRSRGLLPEPYAETSSGPIWTEEQVRKVLEERHITPLPFSSVYRLCQYLARVLADETPKGWFREVGVQKEEDGTCTLVHLSDGLTGDTYTTWTPGEGEIKISIEPCPDRGTSCPHTGARCDRDEEIDCTAEAIMEKIQEAFAEAG